jgi:hypothetical protein
MASSRSVGAVDNFTLGPRLTMSLWSLRNPARSSIICLERNSFPPIAQANATNVGDRETFEETEE